MDGRRRLAHSRRRAAAHRRSGARRGPELRERPADVVHPQCDVVEARAALRDELRNRGIRRGRFEQFEAGIAAGRKCARTRCDAPLRTPSTVEPERVAKESERRTEVATAMPM